MSKKVNKKTIAFQERLEKMQGIKCKSKCCKKYKKAESKRCKKCPCFDLLKKVA